MNISLCVQWRGLSGKDCDRCPIYFKVLKSVTYPLGTYIFSVTKGSPQVMDLVASIILTASNSNAGTVLGKPFQKLCVSNFENIT